MEKQITLHLDAEVVAAAEANAKAEGTSLSRVVERYLERYTKSNAESEEDDLSPRVRALSGIAKVPNDVTYDDLRMQYLREKY